MFFCLSGFLITWLIIKEETKHTKISLRAFYVRRCLRILPPAMTYVVILAVLKIFALPEYPIQSDWGAFISSTFFYKNFYYGNADEFGHFWTLALEEQFYLLWPISFILLKDNTKRLWFVTALVLIAPFWRHFNTISYDVNLVNWKRTDFHLDSMLIGCMLALLMESRYHSLLKLNWLHSSTSFVVYSSIITVSFLDQMQQLPGFIKVFLPSLRLVMVALMINSLITNKNNWVNRLLNTSPVTYIGLLSYSLYIWQQLFCYSYYTTWDRAFPANLIMTFLAAAASYHLIETPILRLRERRGYGRITTLAVKTDAVKLDQAS